MVQNDLNTKSLKRMFICQKIPEILNIVYLIFREIQQMF